MHLLWGILVGFYGFLAGLVVASVFWLGRVRPK